MAGGAGRDRIAEARDPQGIRSREATPRGDRREGSGRIATRKTTGQTGGSGSGAREAGRASPRTSYEDALHGREWSTRRRALRVLFEDIEPKYDGLNRRLSVGLDQMWRRWAANAITAPPEGPWLDIASGTGDLAVFVWRRLRALRPDAVPQDLLRLDLSPLLLARGREKLERESGDAPASGAVSHGVAGEMDSLPLADGSVAVLIQGFALRHCRDLGSFFRELHRILRPGGQVVLLDMRYPRRGIGTGIYRFYFRAVLPRLAALFGADRGAYRFMVDSVRALPEEEEIVDALRRGGFTEIKSKRGFLGAVALLSARRP